MHNDVHEQPDELALFTPSRVDTDRAMSGSSFPKLSSNEFANPATRLQHCLYLQTRAIALLEDQRHGLSEQASRELLALLKEAACHQHTIALDFCALQAETRSLQTERSTLATALRHTETLSLTDELTGLPNRRAFVQRLDQELSRSQRTGQPLAIVLLDIDNFKGINDHYGHDVGDMILRCYAQSMVRELRQHDLLARYGGEEFVLLLPETSLDDARNALVKLGGRLQCEPLNACNACIDLPTFSAGIATLRPGEAVTALINRADQSLYRAKRLGRNRIETDQAFPI